MIEVELPDGSIAEFPDGTSNDVIKGALQKRFAPPAQAEQPSSEAFTSAMSDMSGMTQNPARAKYDALPGWQKPIVAASDTLQLMGSGASFGFGEKAAAAARAPFTDKTYEEELAAQRGLTQGARNRAGGAGVAAEIGGAIAGTAGAAKQGLTLAGRLGTGAMEGFKGLAARTGLMAAEGAGYGALTAAGNDQDIASGAGIGALAGGAGNVAGEALSAGASKIAGMFNKKPPTMSSDQLKDVSRAAYDRADAAGVVVNPQGLQRLASQVQTDLADFGYHPSLQPRIATVLEELDRVGQGNATFKGVDVLRKIASSAGASMDPSEKALASKIVARIDDYMGNLGPNDVLSGNASEASAAIKEARDYWGRARKMETASSLVERAGLNAGSTGSGGNVENATRQQLKRILTSDKMKRGFTADEQKAIKDVVLGTPTQNALRLAGKLSPQGNGLMLLAGGAGMATAPGIAIPAMAGGYLAKKGAETMTEMNVKKLSELIASGGKNVSAPKNALQRLSESKREALARLLMAGGVNQAVAP